MRILTVFLCMFFSLQFHAQRSTKPWSNAENYKEGVIESVKKTPELMPSKSYDNTNKSNIDKVVVRSKIERTTFVNGINIAWVNFGRDIGFDPKTETTYRPDIEEFTNIMNLVSEAGGNVVRWWYHTNGSTNPVFDENQRVIANPEFFYEDVNSILDLAASKNLKVQICLWSFDMLKDQWNVDATANKKLLTEEVFYQSYIDNALLPLVNQIGDHPGLYAWEIFNEAEGMTNEYGSHWPDFKEKVSIVDVQRFVNRTAAAIRKEQPSVKITNGALGFITAVDDSRNGYKNMYSDKRLQEIGGEEEGYLDFYNIHYYSWAGINGSPFHNIYNPEKLDKEAVIAEYYPDDTFGIQAGDTVIALLEKGWHGSLLWSWTDRPWEIMESILVRASDYISSDTSIVFEEIKMFPNPTRDLINIVGLEIETEITIVDPTGKIVKKQLYDPNIDTFMDVTDLTQGTYYVRFGEESSKIIVKI